MTQQYNEDQHKWVRRELSKQGNITIQQYNGRISSRVDGFDFGMNQNKTREEMDAHTECNCEYYLFLGLGKTTMQFRYMEISSLYSLTGIHIEQTDSIMKLMARLCAFVDENFAVIEDLVSHLEEQIYETKLSHETFNFYEEYPEFQDLTDKQTSLHIQFTLDGAEPSSLYLRDKEIVRILTKLADRIDSYSIDDDEQITLSDINGNSVGSAKLVVILE